MQNAKLSLEIEIAVNEFKNAQNKACYGWNDLTFPYYNSITIAGGINHISFSQCSNNIEQCLQNCDLFIDCRNSYKSCLEQICASTGEYTMECYSQMNTNTMALDNAGYYLGEAARSHYGCNNGGGGGGNTITCGGNQCSEGINSCCTYQGNEVCGNFDGSCPQEGNQCGTGYCNVGEQCCSGNFCTSESECPNNGGGEFCNNDGICNNGENADFCPSDCGCNFDGICQSGRGETTDYCPSDCGCNSNGICEPHRGEAFGTCEDCSYTPDEGNGSDDGGANNGGTNPCPGGWMGTNGNCEYPPPTCNEGFEWNGADCSCYSPKIDFGGICREATERDCLTPRGSSWDDYQQRCVCPSQSIDNGMGDCVSDSNNFIDPYYRRLRGLAK
jgi:hypothetical protein